MQRRISVLAILVTLTCWFGQIVGCASPGQDQNYKVLEDDRPMFDTRHDPNKPGARLDAPASASGSLLLTAPEAGDAAQAAMDKPEENTDTETIAKVQDALAAAPADQRSVTGLDRSHWDTIVVGPNLQGSYLPNYVHEITTPEPILCRIAFERLQFVSEIVMMPVRMVITPPWQRSAASTYQAYDLDEQPEHEHMHGHEHGSDHDPANCDCEAAE